MAHPTDAEYQATADSVPIPRTPGLEVSENDPTLIKSYDDCRDYQLTYHYLDAVMSPETLLWLAGHTERPGEMPAADWDKLRANAWRARVTIDRKSDERKAELGRRENWKSRVAQIAAGLLAVALGFGLSQWAARGDDDGPSEPLRIEALLVEVGRGLGVRVRVRVQGSRHRCGCSTTATTRRSLRWVTVVGWPKRCSGWRVCA